MGPKFAAALLFAATAASAQQWEVGGSLGYGWYRNVRVNGPGAEAKAGIRSRFTAGAVLTEDLYEHISGEIRYTYHDGDPFISLGGRTANMQGQSHSFTYDTLFHVRDRDHRLRPYFAAGIGAKYFRTTGPEPVPQPAPGVASLVAENQWRLLVSVGAGVSYRFPNHLLLRADFRDYISPLPRKIFSPAAGATGRGLMHQFTPMVGIGLWF
jgi:opacity protein-like surface antigen